MRLGGERADEEVDPPAPERDLHRTYWDMVDELEELARRPERRARRGDRPQKSQ